MAIQADYERATKITSYVKGKTKMVMVLDDVFAILGDAVAFKTAYPADAAEVDGDIQWVKNRCQTIIDTY